MADVANTFEGGSAGTTITTANSGGASGDPFQFIQIVAGGTVTYTATAFRGSLAGQFASGATVGTCYAEYTTSIGAASTGQVFCRLRFRLPTLPADTTGVRIVVVGDSTGSFRAELRVTSTGAVSLRGSAGTALATFSATYVAGDWWDVALAVLVFSTTVGQIEARKYAADGSITQTLTSTANLDTVGAGGANKLQAGMLRSIANHTVLLDDVAWSTTAYPSIDGLTGTAASTLPSTTSTATGVSRTTGLTAQTLPSATSAVTGVSRSAGSAAQTLPPVTSTASATSRSVGLAGQTLSAATSAAAGAMQASGTSAASLPGLVAAATGVSRSAAIIAGTLSAAVAAGTGGQHSRTTTRPDTGTTARPSTGVTTRPYTGVTARP
jgi:hypothetical protein